MTSASVVLKTGGLWGLERSGTSIYTVDHQEWTALRAWNPFIQSIRSLGILVNWPFKKFHRNIFTLLQVYLRVQVSPAVLWQISRQLGTSVGSASTLSIKRDHGKSALALTVLTQWRSQVGSMMIQTEWGFIFCFLNHLFPACANRSKFSGLCL